MENGSTEQLRLVFDPAYYSGQLGGEALNPDELFQHFSEAGWRRGLDPHPLFSTAYYFEQRADVEAAGKNPLEHYLKWGFQEGAIPHPLFDTALYLRQLDGSPLSTSPLVDYLTGGYRSRSPHLLFDDAYYTAQLQAYRTKQDRAQHHLCSVSRQQERRVQEQALSTEGTPPFVHYLGIGHKLGFAPHPLFSTRCYCRQKPSLQTQNVNPLVHYVRWGFHEGLRPHPLFNAEHYAAQTKLEPHTNPLIHFLQAGFLTIQCTPLFDAGYYLEQLAQRRLEVPAGVAPLVHFISTGWQLDINPHPLFDVAFYRRNCPQFANYLFDPLSHYVEEGHKFDANPHPYFDSAYYAARHKVEEITAIEHYVQACACGEKPDPCWGLDAERYSSYFPEIDHCRLFPSVHLARSLHNEITSEEAHRRMEAGIPSKELHELRKTLCKRRGLSRSALPFRAIVAVSDASDARRAAVVRKMLELLHGKYDIETYLFWDAAEQEPAEPPRRPAGRELAS